MDYSVLIVDDETELAESTAEYFNMFDVPSKCVFNAKDAMDFFKENTARLILLDINLEEKGGISGFDLCKKIRQTLDVPILFISARSSDDDMVIALNIGGDDYIKKPYTLSILLAKVKTILQRYEKARQLALDAVDSGKDTNRSVSKDGIINISDTLKIDTKLHIMTMNGEKVALKEMEYKLMLYLAENRGRVITNHTTAVARA